MVKKLFSLLILLISCAFVFQAHAQNRDDLQRQQRLLQREIDQLNGTLKLIRQNKRESIGQLVIVERKLTARQMLIDNISQEIHQIDGGIAYRREEITKLMGKLDTLKQHYAQSIVFAYKNRSNYDLLSFLFSASDFNDAIKRMMYLKSYRRYREDELNNIRRTQAMLRAAIKELNDNRFQKNQALSSQNNQLIVLQQDRQEKAQVVQNLKGKEQQLTVQLKRREHKRIQLKHALDIAISREVEAAQKLEKEKREAALREKERIEKENAAKNKETETPANSNEKTASAGPLKKPRAVKSRNRSYSPLEATTEGLSSSLNFENRKGHLPWPVSGYVTGHFGTQSVPGTQLTEHNDGVVITTSVGAPVHCVAEGEVVRIIDLNESKAVLLKHGRYFTTYSNLSSVSVSKGEHVNAGTVIGQAAANYDGDGEVIFMILNERNQFLNPESWLKR